MKLKTEIDTFWQNYLGTLPTHQPKPVSYTAWYFGNTARLAEELGTLVAQGIKTATCSLFWEFEADGEPLPEAGQLSIITDFDGQPLCIIETIEVQILPYDQVPAQFAWEEGEGDRSLDYWRQAHWRYFSPTCVRLGREPSEDMPLVCERFRLMYPDPGRAKKSSTP